MNLGKILDQITQTYYRIPSKSPTLRLSKMAEMHEKLKRLYEERYGSMCSLLQILMYLCYFHIEKSAKKITLNKNMLQRLTEIRKLVKRKDMKERKKNEVVEIDIMTEIVTLGKLVKSDLK